MLPPLRPQWSRWRFFVLVDMATINDLKPDKRNARKHTPRNVGMIEHSIQTNGFGRSVLLASDGSIIAGNATYEAAASAGLDDVLIVESDGTKVIAVKRTDVQPGSERFHALAIADNRAAELAEWDATVLEELSGEIDLSAFFFDAELARVLQQEPEFDAAAEWDGMPEFSHEDLQPIKQVIVSFATEGDIEAFADLINQRVDMNTKSIWFPPAEIGHYKHTAYVEVGNAS